MLRQKLHPKMAAYLLKHRHITVKTPEKNVLENFSRLFNVIFGNYMPAITRSFVQEPGLHSEFFDVTSACKELSAFLSIFKVNIKCGLMPRWRWAVLSLRYMNIKWVHLQLHPKLSTPSASLFFYHFANVQTISFFCAVCLLNLNNFMSFFSGGFQEEQGKSAAYTIRGTRRHPLKRNIIH